MNLPIQAAPVGRLSQFGPSRSRGIEPNFCVNVVVNGQGQVCVDIPVLGQKCIPLHTPLPSGTAASACVDICKTWGIPSGACITVTALGQQVAHECIGKC